MMMKECSKCGAKLRKFKDTETDRVRYVCFKCRTILHDAITTKLEAREEKFEGDFA